MRLNHLPQAPINPHSNRSHKHSPFLVMQIALPLRLATGSAPL